MIIGVVNQTVIGKYNAFCTPAFLPCGADIAFIIDTPSCFRQLFFQIAEDVSSNAAAGEIQFQRPAFPTCVPGYALGDIVVGEMSVSANIKCYFVSGIIPAVFLYRK